MKKSAKRSTVLALIVSALLVLSCSIPSWAVTPAGNGSGATPELHDSSGVVPAPLCDKLATNNALILTTTIAGVSGKRIFICSAHIMLTGTTVTTAAVVYGTGTNCGTTAFYLIQTAPSTSTGYIAETVPYSPAFEVPSGDEVCVSASVTGEALYNTQITYAQY